MMWSVILHGSYWAGCPDAPDVDVLVVTDGPWTRETVPVMLTDVLRGVPRGRLTLDTAVATPAEVAGSVFLRAIVEYGELVEGDPVDVQPITAAEWAAWMRERVAMSSIPAGMQVLALLRAWWADEGRIVLPKSAVPAAAVGTPYEALAARAWAARKDPAVTLEDLLTAAGVAVRGASGAHSTAPRHDQRDGGQSMRLAQRAEDLILRPLAFHAEQVTADEPEER